MFDHDSKIACHVHENNHEMDFGSVRVVGHEANYHERLFLEAWYSIKMSSTIMMYICVTVKFYKIFHAVIKKE